MKKNSFHIVLRLLFLGIVCLSFKSKLEAQTPAFKVLIVASADPDHDPMISNQKHFLKSLLSKIILRFLSHAMLL